MVLGRAGLDQVQDRLERIVHAGLADEPCCAAQVLGLGANVPHHVRAHADR